LEKSEFSCLEIFYTFQEKERERDEGKNIYYSLEHQTERRKPL
jgi:hypothetical protein